MRRLLSPVVWTYDFLAEDFVLLLGTAIAIAMSALAVHAVKNAAGIILFALLVVVIASSLWRAASVGEG